MVLVPTPPRTSIFASGLASGLLAALLLLSLGGLGACTRKIGDNCATNVECSPQGDRFCDIASPDGYCTIDSCDYQTCPDSANCVRFYVLKVNSGLCDAGRVARDDCPDSDPTCCKPGSGTKGCCQIGERCLCATAGCQKGYCASDASERRWCMANCDKDSDCRDGYVCQTTGQNGAEAIPYREDNGNLVTQPPALKFCAPDPALSTAMSVPGALQSRAPARDVEAR